MENMANIYIPLKMYMDDGEHIGSIDYFDKYGEADHKDFINSSKCKSLIHKTLSDAYGGIEDFKSVNVTIVNTTDSEYICKETYTAEVVFDPDIRITHTFTVIGLTLRGYTFLKDIEDSVNSNGVCNQELFDKISTCVDNFTRDMKEVNEDELLSIKDNIFALTNGSREHVSVDA